MKSHMPPEVLLNRGPYRRSAEHLRDELARVDLLVRAQVVRWRLTIGQTKAEEMWGMVYVTDAEIDRYMSSPIAPPDRLPESLLHALKPFWEAEALAGRQIRENVQATASEVDLRVNSLSTAFQLTDLERDLVLVCLLAELDFRYRRMLGYLQDDVSHKKPPVELLLQIMRPRAESLEEARAAFEPEGTLLSKRLLVLSGEDDNRATRSVRLDERIASYLLGSDGLDARLSNVVVRSAEAVKWDELLFDDALIAHLRHLADYVSLGKAILFFHGLRGSGREKAAHAICTQNGMQLLRVDVAAALQEQTRWEVIVDLAFREARLAGAAIYWADVDLLPQDEQASYRVDYLRRAAGNFQGLTILSATVAGESYAQFRTCLPLHVDFPVPHFERRRKIWLAYLPPEDELPNRNEIAETLAGAFQLNEGQVRDSVVSARELARRRDVFNPKVTSEDLYDACRKQAGRRLLGFARRIEPSRKLSLDDVILAETNKRQLKELLNRIRLRSRLYSEMKFGRSLAERKGLLVLFAGSSGTGKTMSAELLASEEGVDLYKVDLSAIVSKWVGETEKNLNRVFAEAEDSNALLFFDECDALFGQRGEIREAKDRWANLEVNYLLQRVEEYSGVVIMATNLRQNIDDAFLRRIQVIIEFPSPDSELRLKIWERSLPPPPHSDISEDDLRNVANRFAITGGNIRNIVIDAAFRALADHRAGITLRDLVDSIAREYQKIGKPITQGDFGKEFFGWVVADILSPPAEG